MSDSGRTENLTVDDGRAVATVTITRPKVLDALDASTLADLPRTMVRLGQDGTVRSAVLQKRTPAFKGA